MQRYTEITHHPLIFSFAQGIFLLSTERHSRSTLYLQEGGSGESVTTPRCVANSDKIPEGGTSTYILHLSGWERNINKIIFVFWASLTERNGLLHLE
jgi:hypothetical protein